MDSLLTQEKQAQAFTFQTAQIQKNQAPVAVNQHSGQMRESNRTSVRSGYAQKASPFDKAKKGAVVEDVYTLSQSSVRNNYSDERMDAFRENLIVNIEIDMREAADRKMLNVPEEEWRAYQSMLSAISSYAHMDMVKTPRTDQAEVLKNAMGAIDSFLEEYGNTTEKNRATSCAGMYQDYLRFFTNGSLFVREEKPGLKIDATAKKDAPKLYRSFQRYADRSEDPLFPHEPSMNDVKQLGLGDCYLQAAVSSLVMNDPQQLKDSMRDNGNGTVTVRFFKKYSKLTGEEQTEYEVARLSEGTRQLWEKEADFRELNDADLIFKLLQKCGDNSILSSVAQCFGKEKNERIEQYIAGNQAASADEQRQFVAEQSNKYSRLIDMMNKNGSRKHAEHTRSLANYLAGQAAVKNQVIENMREALSQDAADLNVVINNALIRLFYLMPDYDENSSLEDPEKFNELLSARDQMADPQNEDMIPVYVTVTKEAPVGTFSGEDAYTDNCLWMQMLEKAYAASGLHENGTLKEHEAKNKKEVEDLKTRLRGKNQSEAEITEQVNALKAKQEKELHQWRHSFEGIVGGQSGVFLETFTGKKSDISYYDQATPQWMTNQLFNGKLMTELCQADQRWNKQIVDNFYPWILDSMRQALEKKHAKHAIKIKNKNGKDVTHYPRPFYLEDMLELLKNADENSDWISDTCRDNFKKFGPLFQNADLQAASQNAGPQAANQNAGPQAASQNADLQAASQNADSPYTLKGFLHILKDTLPRMIGMIDGNEDIHILHRPFSGHYTKYAEKQYANLCASLEKKKAVNIGTRMFLPKGSKATGRNGESEQGGLVEGHAFTVVGVEEKDKKYFVQLRNPWADGEMGYQKTTNPDHTEEITSKRVDAKTGGHFYMEWNDFLSRISNIDIN